MTVKVKDVHDVKSIAESHATFPSGAGDNGATHFYSTYREDMK